MTAQNFGLLSYQENTKIPCTICRNYPRGIFEGFHRAGGAGEDTKNIIVFRAFVIIFKFSVKKYANISIKRLI